jgi:Ohr subfamily peroxiredoxin
LKPLYTAVAEVTGGRDGRARLADRPDAIELSSPAAMGGTGTGFNPEQLFAVAFGACFSAALDLEARQRGIILKSCTVVPHVSIGHGDDGHFNLAIELHVRLPGLSRPVGERLMHAADAACPYAKLARGSAQVSLVLDSE